MNDFCHSQSQGIRLSKLWIGFDYVEPSEADSSKGNATSVYFKVGGLVNIGFH